MLIHSSNPISKYQIASLSIISVITLGFVDLHGIAKYIAIDAWIPSLLAVVISPLIVWINIRLAEKFPEQMITSYMPNIVGKVLGFFLGLFLSLYYLLVAVVVFRFYLEFTKVYLLPKTPNEVIIFTQLIIIIYAAWYGIHSVARISEIVMPLTVIFALFLLSTTFAVDYSNILPIAENGVLPIMTKVSYALPYFIPVSGIITFFYPYINHKTKLLRPVLLSSLGAGIIVVILNISIAGMFGYEIKDLYFPGLNYFQKVNVPIMFVERIVLFLLMILFPFFFINNLTSFFTSVLSFTALFKLRDPSVFIIILFPVYFLLLDVPLSVAEVFLLRETARFSSLFVLSLPALLLIIYRFRKKKHLGKRE